MPDAAGPPLAAWGLTGPGAALPAGAEAVFKCGHLVLKHADNVEEAEWCAGALAQVGEDGFRLARPVRALDGRWVVDGWTACHWVEGANDVDGRWAELLAAGRAFHRAMAHVPRPDLFARRRTRWAVADRVAWDEADIPIIAALDGPFRALRARLRPPAGTEQVVHGDLSGNVLFALGLAPAIIDFSPYWRPAPYADAVALVDGLLYREAPDAILDEHLPGADGAQYAARACLFRAATLSQYLAALPRDADAHAEVAVTLRVMARLRRRL